MNNDTTSQAQMISLHHEDVHQGPDVLPPTARGNVEEPVMGLSSVNDNCIERLSNHFWNLATAPNTPQEERDLARAEWLSINIAADLSGNELDEANAMLDDAHPFTAAMVASLFRKLTDTKQRLSDMYKSVGLPDEEFERVAGVPRHMLIGQCSTELVAYLEEHTKTNTSEVLS